MKSSVSNATTTNGREKERRQIKPEGDEAVVSPEVVERLKSWCYV